MEFHFGAGIIRVSRHGPGFERLEIVRETSVRGEEPLMKRVEAGEALDSSIARWDHAFAMKTSSATSVATTVA